MLISTGLVYASGMRYLLLILCLLFALPSLARDIYKWTSDEGIVIYSDTSQAGAEKVRISTGQGAQSDNPAQAKDSKATADEGQYQTFEVAQPENDDTIRNDEGTVTVGLSLSPALLPGHKIHIYLDGDKIPGEVNATQFTLNKLNRGTHSLQVKVVDAENNPQISTSLVNFHLRKTSSITP